MASYPSQEQRPLKRPRLGPPDVYPQDPKQKEDELSTLNVKHGFSNNSTITDEHGSARNLSISQDKFGACFSAVMTKKIELNTFQDTGKKKQQLNTKDNFWPVTAKKGNAMEAWFKDLGGSKPLSHLGKKVPMFNKKEEIFMTLCDFSIPMVKAAWFIKMIAVHNATLQENKTKKRQTIDQSSDWSQALTKFMKEQLQRIQEHYHGTTNSGPQTSFLTATQPPTQVDFDTATKYWEYCCRLSRHMYEEGLLERHEFLYWLLELLDKLRSTDDAVLKILMGQVVYYLDEICTSVFLARRLAHFCAWKIAHFCSEPGCVSPQSPMMATNGNGTMTNSSANPQLLANPLSMLFSEYTSCFQHRGIILTLCATLQTVTLRCPASLVWNNLGDGKSNSVLCGSPLDLLMCAPSSLPMPPSPQNPQIRAQIRSAEQQIRLRGRAAEVRWSSDKCQQSTTGFTISKVLNVLDILDRHNFDKVDTSNSIDSLYNKIFCISQSKDGTEPLVNDDPVIRLLIDWAVSTQRTGSHRSIVVAKLMEKHQMELQNEKFVDTEMIDDKDSIVSDAMGTSGYPAFQSLLMDFLDNNAPVQDENPSEESKQAFQNLIRLFSELIRFDVFSHDAYLCALISRGNLVSSPSITMPSADSVDLSSVKSLTESIKHEHQDDIKMDLDIHTMESDLGSLFGPVKEEQKTSPEAPASVKSVRSEKDQTMIPSVGDPQASQSQHKGPSRHMLYATHFPVPQDESYAHECNQRLVVLYGVGKARDNARHVVKKITKEIQKLFSKKNCIDISSGGDGKGKKKKEKEKDKDSDSCSNLESTFNKFQKLSYYDQHYVTTSSAASVIEQLGSFASGSSTYLPLVDNISYLFDLMEYALNTSGLIDFALQLLKELSQIEIHPMLKLNIASLCLCIAGIFRKYHAYMLVTSDLITQAFEGLSNILKNIGGSSDPSSTERSNIANKHVSNPTDCMSAEKCVQAFLFDLFTSASYLKAKYSDVFGNAYSKMKQTMYASIQPSDSNLLWDPNFMMGYLNDIKLPVDEQLVKKLIDNPAHRYSFVCNAMLNICNSQATDRLNEISILCAELTAKCSSLRSEWLGVLKALCCSSNHSCGFIDILTQIDVSDLSIHDSLAVFTAILIARHCFRLEDLVFHVALPSLMAACSSSLSDQDAECGARLTCHLLLRLFKTSHLAVSAPSPNGRNICGVKASCDKHLLAATHDSIKVGAVLAVLKAMLILRDSCSNDSKLKAGANNSSGSCGGSNPPSQKTGDIISNLLGSLEDDNIMDMDLMFGDYLNYSNSKRIESAGLSEFAKHALKEMCCQEWVQEKILKDPEGLFHEELLMDPELGNKQAQQLLQMICYPNGIPNQVEGNEPDNKQVIQRILQTLDQWSLRVSWLELMLMFKQEANKNSILDSIAKGTLDLFHQQTEFLNNPNSPRQILQQLQQQQQIVQQQQQQQQQQTKPDSEKDSVWLVAPLISRLPSSVQGRVLKLAGQVLESSNNFLSKSKFDKEKNQRSKSLLGHQPFLSLILTCLKGQDEQREGLLSSLHSQLEKFINNVKEVLDRSPDESKIRQNLHEALQLRLSLVGGMFDTIQRNNTTTSDWAILLVQLVSHGVVDIQTNYELFTTVIDMLNVLIHGTLVSSDPTDKGDDNKRSYLNLIKKIKRELGDKNSEGIDKVRQLLPLAKQFYEVITCEPHGTLVDTKGNKIAGFDSIGRKQGLQVASMVKVSPWEVIEGHKNPAPMSWTYFGAVKMEKKMLKYEDQHRLMLYHTHMMRQPTSYYLEPLNLPPEDLEPPVEKVEEKPKETAENQKDEQSKSKKQQRRRRPPRTPSSYIQQPVRLNYGQEPMYQPRPPPNWYGPPQPQQQPPFYSTHLPPGGPTRFGAAQQYNNPKQALSSMIRARQPATQGYIQTNSQQFANIHILQTKHHRQQFVRHTLRAQQQNRMAESQAAHYNNPQTTLHHMTQSPASFRKLRQVQSGQWVDGMIPPDGRDDVSELVGINQNYPSYSGMQLQQPTVMESGMMSQNFSQSYASGQNPGMLQAIPQQTQQQQSGYISQQPPQQTQPPYNPTSRLPHSMPPSNIQRHTGTMGSMPTYNQMGPSGPPQPQGHTYIQSIPQTQQQLQQMQQQHRILAMQKQQLQTPQQQQTAALVAQLQRQMSGPHPQQPGPQYNTYPQPPQY